MSARTTSVAVGAVVATVLLATYAAAAQNLAGRVDAAPAGAVEFTFAARTGVCGNGRSYIQTAPGNFTGSVNTNTLSTEPCAAGPVRVVIDRANREIIAIQTYVGPRVTSAATTDLGRVSPQLAADFLLALAAKSDGRVGRDAILPATLADSANIADALLAVARNQALARDTRTSALSYVGRSDERLQAVPAGVVTALTAVARDEADNMAVRKQAVTVLGRLEHGAGIPALIDLAGQNTGAWVAREAMTVLSTSGDPRARTYLRSAVQRPDLGEESMAIAIRALGQQYSTPADAALLRSLYPRLTSDRSRDAILTSVADVGGAANVTWLLDLTKNEAETPARRRKALDAATRAGASTAELVRLYDVVSDQTLKDALVSAYSRSGETAAVDKLIGISKIETNVTIRRKAITALSTSTDPRVKEALTGLITRP